MKKKENIVILSLDKYNEIVREHDELLEFKNKTEKKSFVYHTSNCSHFYSGQKFVSTDDALKLVVQENEALRKEISNCKRNIKQIESIKKMSIWEFLKFRRRK